MAQYLSLYRLETQLSLEPSELSFLQARLVQLEAEVSSLTEEIDAHETRASHLIPRKNAKLVELDLFKNILAPIRRIPPEILGYIFELSCDPWCLPQHIWKVHLYIDEYRTSSPVAISKVCVAWRQVAHMTPQIWSNLVIDVNRPKHFAALGNDVSWVKDWLARSQGYPLKISLGFLTWESRVLEDRVKSGIWQVLNHSLSFRSKIQVLTLKSFSAQLHAFVSLPPLSFPMLECLTLVFEERYAGEQSTSHLKWLADTATYPIKAFLGAAKLRTVHITEASETLSLFQVFALPIRQLTSLAVSGEAEKASPQVYLELILQCKALTTFRFYPSESIDSTVTNFPQLFWPTLTSLTISHLQESCSGDLFDCLTTPSLKELVLLWCNGNSYYDLSTRLISFQARSMAKLSSLDLKVFNAPDAGEHFKNLIVALRAFPTVESFFLVDSYPSGWDLLFQNMTYSNGRLDVLFPKLTELSLTCKEVTEYPQGLDAMLLSRQSSMDELSSGEEDNDQQGVRQLQKLTLQLNDFDIVSPEDLAFLDGLVSDVNIY